MEQQNKEPIDRSIQINDIELKTHKSIDPIYSGSIISLREGYSKIELRTSPEMSVDQLGLVHGGFIFSAADHAAMVAVNEPNVVLATAKTTFFAPAKLGDTIFFEAQVYQRESRRRIINVKAKILDIKIFEGEFSAVVLDRHVLRLKLNHNLNKD